MAKQDVKGSEQQQDQPAHQMARGAQQQPQAVARAASNPIGFLAPGELFRLSPFSLLRRMSEEMDRVFGEFGLNRTQSGRTMWVPVVEASEQDSRFVVRAELPGVNPGDVKLEITDDAVILQGERKSEREEARRGLHLTERQYGQFFRSIPLPERGKAEEARAKFDNGVLEITVPLAEQKTKRREIPIESSSTPAPAGKAA
jgi:HSP20 family protein